MRCPTRMPTLLLPLVPPKPQLQPFLHMLHRGSRLSLGPRRCTWHVRTCADLAVQACADLAVQAAPASSSHGFKLLPSALRGGLIKPPMTGGRAG
jgi:hypothetical protein